MRRAAKVDINQQEIVSKLERCGVKVQSLAAVGCGCPDLLCGFRGVNVLLEVKRSDGVPSLREPNAMQKKWHETWGGQVALVWTWEQAMDVICESAGLKGERIA